MSSSPLKKFVLTPVVLSATVFAALTLPLAVLGSKPVTIKLQQEQVFQGQLRDVATPYLGLASVLSLGAGLATVAITGWRLSTRKSSQVEAQLSAIAQNLQEKEAQLEALKLSQSRLEVSGLSKFIDEEVPLEQLLNKNTADQGATPVVEPMVSTTQPVKPTAPAERQVMTVQAAARQFASAQTFLGYAQAHAAAKPDNKVSSLGSSELEQLHTQLQQIMAQMASVQTALSAHAIAVNSEAQVSAQAQLEVVKSSSLNKKAS
jgi:hypothetical protein